MVRQEWHFTLNRRKRRTAQAGVGTTNEEME